MGNYVYQIKKSSARKMVGGEAVHVATFYAKDCRGNEGYIAKLREYIFDSAPLFVEGEMKAGSVVFEKSNRYNSYIDCSDFGTEIGRLVEVGGRFKLIRVTDVDAIVRDCSCFADFQALLDATGDHYSPSIYADSWEKIVLADAFDAAKALRGESCRAYRGTGFKLS